MFVLVTSVLNLLNLVYRLFFCVLFLIWDEHHGVSSAAQDLLTHPPHGSEGVVSQQSSVNPVWRLHFLTVLEWLFSGCAGFPPHSKNMLFGFIGNSKLSFCMRK